MIWNNSANIRARAYVRIINQQCCNHWYVCVISDQNKISERIYEWHWWIGQCRKIDVRVHDDRKAMQPNRYAVFLVRFKTYLIHLYLFSFCCMIFSHSLLLLKHRILWKTQYLLSSFSDTLRKWISVKKGGRVWLLWDKRWGLVNAWISLRVHKIRGISWLA